MLSFPRALLSALLLGLLGCSGASKPTGSEQAAPRTIEIRARVTVVLRSGQKVAIDAGRDRGIVIGTAFTIYRKGEMIGQVQVTAVWSKECGGAIVKSRRPVLTGDEATAVVTLSDPDAKLEPEKPLVVSPGTIHARIVAVKEKAGKVIINAGERQGVKLGRVFYIYRKDSYVGRVKVTVLKPAMSGAEIIEKRVRLGTDCRAVYDPADERRDAGSTRPAPADLDQMIKELEAKIKDPKTEAPDRKAAREVLLRLKKEKAKGK
jgi:hypothetical protein